MNKNRHRQLGRLGIALAIAGAVAGYLLLSIWLGHTECGSGRFAALCTSGPHGGIFRFQGFLSVVGASIAAAPGILLFLSAAIRAEETAPERTDDLD